MTLASPASASPSPLASEADDRRASLRAEAVGGVPESLFRLANALVATGEFAEASMLYRRAAAAGHGGAEVELARMLLFGLGCDAQPRRAVESLLQAEATGNPVAGYWLAWVALGSVLLPRGGEINRRMLVAVQHDYPPALLAAAIHFGRKPGAGDQLMCVKLLERAAGHGDVLSALLLAERLQRGEGCAVQPAAAAEIHARLRHEGFDALPATVAPPVQSGLPRHTPANAVPVAIAFDEVLAPPRATPLAARPRVLQVDGLLSSDECRLLIASALLRERHAPAGSVPSGTAPSVRFEPVHEDFALRMVQLRLARAARVELAHAEALQVQRIVPGMVEWRHRDYLSPDALAADRPLAGNRHSTLRACLGAPEAGGGVEFPFGELQTVPVTGRAIVFDNLRDGVLDRDSMHAGLPVARGELWQATLWLRERRYRAA